jgi:hypothetical protein
MSTPKPSNKAKEALTAEMNEGDVGFVFIIEASTPKQKIPKKDYAGFWFVFKERQWEHIVYM